MIPITTPATTPAFALASLAIVPVYLLIYGDLAHFVFHLPLYLSFTLTSVLLFAVFHANRLDRSATSSSDRLSRQRHALRPFLFTSTAKWSGMESEGSHDALGSITSLYPLQHTTKGMAEKLDTFFKLILRSFVLPWFDRLSPSSVFPNAVEGLLRHSLENMVKRAEEVDWSTLMVSRILPIITDHIRHYRSVEHLSSTSSTSPNPSLPLPLPKNAHTALSQQEHVPAGLPSPLIEAHLREWLGRVFGKVLPEKERSEVVLTIIREITLGAVLLPTFQMLCDSDFWNRQIEEKGGRYLHEQKQVNKFLSALSSLPHPTSNTTTPVKTKHSSRSKNAQTPTSINAASSTRQFDGFIRSIPKLRTLGEARRLRADVEREQRSVKVSISRETEEDSKEAEARLKSARRYNKRLDRAKVEIDARIAVLTRIQGASPQNSVILPDARLASSINLFMVLSDPSSLAYWLEFMDRRNRSRLVQFWLTVEGFKDPLEMVTQDWERDNPLESSVIMEGSTLAGSATIFEDVSFLQEAYFSIQDDFLQVPVKYREVISQFARRETGQISSDELRRVRQAMFGAQKAVYEEMEEEDWAEFKKGELYRKVVFDLSRNTHPVSIPAPLPSPPLISQLGSPTAQSMSAFSPPSRPVRQMTSPAAPTRRLAEPRSPMSPTPRALPILINGNFTPSATASSLVAITTQMPTFERKLTEPIIQNRKTSGGETDLASSTGSLPSTPPMVKRSSHLDFLISGGERPEYKKERGRLFDDDDVDEALNEEDEDDYVQVQRMEAIQAALNEIIASDDVLGHRIAPSRHSSGSDPAKSLASSLILVPQASDSKPAAMSKAVSRSFEDLRKHLSPRPTTSAPQSRVPSSKPNSSLVHRNSMSKLVETPERTIFSDDVLEEEVSGQVGHEQDDLQDVIQLAVPGNLQLSIEISRLQDKIQDLVKQEHLLDTLTRQAELTGNSPELKILHRSLASVRREQRTAIFQKAQFEQQEEENRLVPGRTRISVPKSVTNMEESEGKQVVRYLVDVKQLREDGGLGAGWVIARRYSEFWEMDKALRDWVGGRVGPRGMEGVIDLPPKKLGINFASSFVESRRIGLERYLQSLVKSHLICNAPPLRTFLSRSQTLAAPAVLDTKSGFTAPISNLAPHNIVKSLYKTMATSLDDSILSPNMLDLMYTTLNRQLNDIGEFVGMSGEEITGLGSAFLPSAIRPTWGRTESNIPEPVQQGGAVGNGARKEVDAGIQPMGGESGTGSFTAPICDLFIEMFDLKENNWLRRQAIVVILQQFLGGTIERKVRDTVRSGMSSESLEKVVANLQGTLWPGGERRAPTEPRTEDEKESTRLSAGRKLGMLIPDVAANMIGRGNARRAARRVFGVLQDRRLNQQLVLCILDEILGALFPPVSRKL